MSQYAIPRNGSCFNSYKMLGKLKPLVAGRSRSPLETFVVPSRPLQGTGRVHPAPGNKVCWLLTALVLYLLAPGLDPQVL